jgi:hypothetical protein
MTISRLTIDKLGVRLYDKVSAVLAELIANGYDADATSVSVRAPMGQLLANKSGGTLVDRGYTIEVEDNGIGIDPADVNSFYLTVGKERRKDPRRGDTSPRFGRRVMGRKGVGKLAPFGICSQIEVISSGGAAVSGKTADGKDATGYRTAHFILDRSVILSDTDKQYQPDVGPLDGSVRPATGTILRLSRFTHRHVPDIADLSRQLAQRFGVSSADWSIALIDNQNADQKAIVGSFDIAMMPSTRLTLTAVRSGGTDLAPRYTSEVLDGDKKPFQGLQAGFEYEDKFYPVTGWIGYAQQSYRDDLMAGVRIYCRGKIAAQTAVFNRRSGFTGEHTVRSYLVGELHADWLDDEEDLIQTDRRDIMWSHELGLAFEQWGQQVIPRIGELAREPVRQRAWERFEKLADFAERLKDAFPSVQQQRIREQALDLGRLIGKTMREDEIDDDVYRESVIQLALTLAPHMTLDSTLREAADSRNSPLDVITTILQYARVAELSSFGRIADDRLKVIGRIEEVKDDRATLEAVFQELITQAPWLIDPQWSPLTANQSFVTLRDEFQKFFKIKTGEELILENFAHSNKRADFVLTSQDTVLQLVEIKRPAYGFSNSDMVRMTRYIDIMEEFLSKDAHKGVSENIQRLPCNSGVR